MSVACFLRAGHPIWSVQAPGRDFPTAFHNICHKLSSQSQKLIWTQTLSYWAAPRQSTVHSFCLLVLRLICQRRPSHARTCPTTFNRSVAAMTDQYTHPSDLPPTQESLDLAARNAVMANGVWIDLTDDLKRDFCDSLASYSGPNVYGKFIAQIGWAARKKHARERNTQTTAVGKRKRDDSDVTEASRASEKRPKVSEPMAPLQSATVDIVTPKIPFVWPAFRQSPIIFGQPTLSSIITGKSPTVALPLTATTSAAAPNLTSTVPPLLKGPKHVPFAQFATTQPEKPVQKVPTCDEHFTFADRRPAQPQPTAGPGAAHQHRPTAQNASSNQPPPIFSANPSQGAHGWQPVTTFYKPPFAGVDMSSLKIPANSNVSVTMNVFHAPSVLHQNMESSAPRKLKCIHCKNFYMESQNTAIECRRHTGTVPVSSSPLTLAGRQRANRMLTFPCRSLRRCGRREIRPA